MLAIEEVSLAIGVPTLAVTLASIGWESVKIGLGIGMWQAVYPGYPKAERKEIAKVMKAKGVSLGLSSADVWYQVLAGQLLDQTEADVNAKLAALCPKSQTAVIAIMADMVGQLPEAA